MDLRESPPQSPGIYDRLIDAFQAFRGSPQKMTPMQAISELKHKVRAYFNQSEEPNFEWLDRVNRLLWVLTSKGDFLVEKEEDLQAILRIWETSTSIFHDRKYKKRNALEYSKNDPRKPNLTLEELLLQIIGRCKELELLYIKVHGSDGRIKELSAELQEVLLKMQSADGKIDELTSQLRGTLEEEKRLTDKLRSNGADAIRSELMQQFEKLKEQYAADLARFEAEIKQLRERELQLKSENSLFRSENRSLQERCGQMSYRIQNLEEENDELRSVKSNGGRQEIVHEIDELPSDDSKELIKTLRTENARLSEENKQFMREREDVIAHYEATMSLRAKVLGENGKYAEILETKNNQIAGIKTALEAANKAYSTGYDNPVIHGEVLYTLLGELDSILNK